jgi:CTP synthase
VDLHQILSDDITPENVQDLLSDVAGILVAPGFGERGIEGKIAAIRYARENDVPFFGICLGMQTAVIEFARNVCGWETAHSTEFDANTSHPVIDLMEEQKAISKKGATMRLGAYTCELQEGSKASEIYGRKVVKERHRHRYELNNVLRYKLAEHGMLFTGVNPKRDLVEIIELPGLRHFIGVQFHPEYKSTVGNPHPLFNAFVRACVAHATETDTIKKPKGPKTKKKRHLASAKM